MELRYRLARIALIATLAAALGGCGMGRSGLVASWYLVSDPPAETPPAETTAAPEAEPAAPPGVYLMIVNTGKRQREIREIRLNPETPPGTIEKIFSPAGPPIEAGSRLVDYPATLKVGQIWLLRTDDSGSDPLRCELPVRIRVHFARRDPETIKVRGIFPTTIPHAWRGGACLPVPPTPIAASAPS